MLLRLVIIGENVFEVCLQDCMFDLGFPFGQVKRCSPFLHVSPQLGMAVVKRIPIGARGEKLVVEQAVTDTGGEGRRAWVIPVCRYLCV